MADKRNEMKIDENTWIKISGKMLWSLITGTFILASLMNYQMFRINSFINSHEKRIETVEKNYWRTPMLSDLTAYTHGSNRVALMSERDIRDLVNDIHARYSR